MIGGIFMTRSFTTGLLTLVLASAAINSARGQEEFKLSEEQQKLIDEFKKTVGNPPLNENDRAAHLKTIQQQLDTLWRADNPDMRDASHILARTFTDGVRNQAIPVDNTVAMSKELLKVLSLPYIGGDDVYRFTNTVDPIVQNTNLRSVEKLRFYREALMVIKTSPNYNPPGR
jgi:hypothetical protein